MVALGSQELKILFSYETDFYKNSMKPVPFYSPKAWDVSCNYGREQRVNGIGMVGAIYNL